MDIATTTTTTPAPEASQPETSQANEGPREVGTTSQVDLFAPKQPSEPKDKPDMSVMSTVDGMDDDRINQWYTEEYFNKNEEALKQAFERGDWAEANRINQASLVDALRGTLQVALGYTREFSEDRSNKATHTAMEKIQTNNDLGSLKSEYGSELHSLVEDLYSRAKSQNVPNAREAVTYNLSRLGHQPKGKEENTEQPLTLQSLLRKE